MGGCRENADLIWWLKQYGIKKTLKRKIWKNYYFLQDTLFTRLNRVIGCKVLGHRKVQNIESDECGVEDSKFCFNCYKEIK